jgi:hypothetical protein
MFFGEPKNIPDVFFGSGSQFKGSRVQGSPFSSQQIAILQSAERRTLNGEPLNCEPER